MSKNYTVQIGNEFSPNSATISGLSKAEAITEAREASKNSGQTVFVSFYRASDGQTVYLCPDGSYDVVGRSWS